MDNPLLPMTARVVRRVEETPDIVTLHLQLADPGLAAQYRFDCGQFNMLYLFGVGEIPISILGRSGQAIIHTIRAVGRVSRAMCALQVGDLLGLRGPYGNGWPLADADGLDMVFVTAGLGCAPVLGAIQAVVERRQAYGRLVIMQGVKHRDDLLWQWHYDQWRDLDNCQVLLAASEEDAVPHRWSMGMVTVLLDKARFDHDNCRVLMCGPEAMMVAAMRQLVASGVSPQTCYLSMERNMQCAVGLCGHCQYGAAMICRDGPVFSYPQIASLLGTRGM